MSSHPYVTQQNTPLADDTTLMSTTDLQSYITHANDTFVQVSGFTLQELQGQPHNMVRHPDMPKAALWSRYRPRPSQIRRFGWAVRIKPTCLTARPTVLKRSKCSCGTVLAPWCRVKITRCKA